MAEASGTADIYYGPGVARMIRDGLIIQGGDGWNHHPSTSNKMSLGAGMVKRLITVQLYQWCVFISPRVVVSDNQIYLNSDKNETTEVLKDRVM